MSGARRYYRTNEEQFVVGIDIAKNTHWANMDDGQSKPFAFMNTRDGYELFIKKVEAARERAGIPAGQKIIVGMEPTGHYWKALGYALKDTERFKVVLVNPYHTKLAKELMDNSKLKSDPKDSRTICDLVRNGKVLRERLPEGAYANLRGYYSLWRYLSKQRQRLKSRIERLVTEYFPEYDGFFAGLMCATSRRMLERYGLAWGVREADMASFERLITKASRGAVSRERARELWNLAKQSIGHERGKEAASLEIETLLNQWKQLDDEEEEVEAAMSKELELCKEAKYLLTFPSMSVVLVCGFLGATGPLSNFHNYRELEKLAGMNLYEISSGEHKGKRHFSKRGRDDLRHVIYLVTMLALGRVDEFNKLYHARLEERPKDKKMLVVGGLMAKTMRILFHLGKHSLSYDATRISLSEVNERKKEEIKH